MWKVKDNRDVNYCHDGDWWSIATSQMTSIWWHVINIFTGSMGSVSQNLKAHQTNTEWFLIFWNIFYLYCFQLEEHGSLTAEELAQTLGMSVLLARERLMTTEKHGQACRDETIEGLRFYPNRFLQRED